MNTTLKQIIGTAIIVPAGLFLMQGAAAITRQLIDNPEMHLVIISCLCAAITILALWLLSKALIILREEPEPSREEQPFTRTITDRHQEDLKRKFAIKD